MAKGVLATGLTALLVAGLVFLGLAFASPEPARAAALAKAQVVRPTATWHVTATQFYWLPYRVYDSQGRLRESESGDPCPLIPLPCPPAPRWVVELSGSDQTQVYEAVVDVSAVTHQVGGWQVLSRLKA